MGPVYADVIIENVKDLAKHEAAVIREDEIRRITVKAMVDTGAYMMVIPEHIRLQLGLDKVAEREALTADGSVHRVPIVGPVNVRFENRLATCNAMVMGHDTVLLGAIPLEEMDVVVEPRTRTLRVNPDNPTMPKMVVM